MLDFAPVLAQASGMHAFLVEADGEPIAAGSMFIEGKVVLLAGASTVPEARGRGAQRALLATRLNWAAHRGCTLAMMCAQPGSQSQRNAERAGFQTAYTRLKWQLPSA
jgi:GNAT superfamily N-acetyltransferase